jgi:hypothetical protein
MLLVIEHDGGAARFANAQLERSVGVLVVEWQAFQAAATFYRQVCVLEENHMGSGLSGNPFANRTVTDMAIDRIDVGIGAVVWTAACIFMCHVAFPRSVEFIRATTVQNRP